VFQLRSRVDQLRFRQGQFGGPPLAEGLKAFEVAPPQVTGVQPFYLTERPPVVDTESATPSIEPWPWGLSALRFSVNYTEEQQGILGMFYPAVKQNPDQNQNQDQDQNPDDQDQNQNQDQDQNPDNQDRNQDQQGKTDPPYRRWWQAPHYQVQFRSALAEDGPAAGLPPYFRAPAIKGLLPTCPNLRLPPTTADDTGWQPVLPGALRYFLTGDRAGVFLSLRHQLVNQFGSHDTLASGSVPVQHRVPRPVPLPPNTAPTTALRPWAHYFAPGQGQAINQTPFDTAFFAEVVRENGGNQPAQGLLITLVPPARGEIDGEWTGEVRLARGEIDGEWTEEVCLQLQDLNPSDSPASWAVRLSLLGPDQPLVYSSENETYSLDPTQQETLATLLRAKVPGDVLTLQAQVTPPGSSSGFYQTLSFPLRLTDFDRSPLPLEPYFIQFEDPEYNRQLASAAAHATQEVLIPAANDQSESASHSVQLSCDRTEYNPDSTLALRYDWDDDTKSGQAILTIRRTRAGVTTSLVPGPSSNLALDQLAPRQLIQLPLADLRLHSQRDQVASLTTGTVLEFQLTIQTKDEISVQPEDKPEDETAKPSPDPVVLTVDIVEDPVTPATEAAYGLLRQRHPGQVECVRFAWGPMPQRIDLIQPEDLRTEIVRRRAVFQWQDAVRPVAPGAEPVHYAIQKISQTGSTYSPPPPLIYDFMSLYSGNSQNGESFELTVDGLTLVMTATRVNPNTGDTQPQNVTISEHGVGVSGSDGLGIGHHGNWVETLRLSFQGQSVHLLSVTFGSTKDNSSFTLNHGDGSEIIQAKTREQMDTPNPEFDFEQAGIVTDQRTGKIFDFSVPALGTDDDYFLRALRVHPWGGFARVDWSGYSGDPQKAARASRRS